MLKPNRRSIRIASVCIAAFVTSFAQASDPAADVQRLQQQREQQQRELQLKMQQQRDRVHHPAATPQGDLQRRHLELSQQLRQQQLHEHQSRVSGARNATSDDIGGQARRDLARGSASRAGDEQLQEFARERRSTHQRPSGRASEQRR